MAGATMKPDQATIDTLRSMAMQGRPPSEMYSELRRLLGTETHIITLLNYFRQAFSLTLGDVKPIAALTRNDQRELKDPAFLDQLLSPAILQHREEWMNHSTLEDLP